MKRVPVSGILRVESAKNEMPVGHFRRYTTISGCFWSKSHAKVRLAPDRYTVPVIVANRVNILPRIITLGSPQ